VVASASPHSCAQDTQCTVNNQIAVSTLMSICDDPQRVSVGAAWRDNDLVQRTPIIVTGAPLPRRSLRPLSFALSAHCCRRH